MHWQKPANPNLLLQSTYDVKALGGGTRLPSPRHSLVFHTLAFCEQFTAQRRRNASLQLTTSTLPLCPMHCCRHPTSLAFKAHNFHAAQGRVVAQRTEKEGRAHLEFSTATPNPVAFSIVGNFFKNQGQLRVFCCLLQWSNCLLPALQF